MVNRIFVDIGFGFLLIDSLMFLYVFVCAFLSPDKLTLVNIDVVGEANLEFLINLLSIPFIVVCIKEYLKN